MRFDPSRSWFAWKYYNPASAEVPADAFVGGYERGWRDCFADQTKLAEALRILQEAQEFIRALELEREAILMLMSETEDEAGNG